MGACQEYYAKQTKPDVKSTFYKLTALEGPRPAKSSYVEKLRTVAASGWRCELIGKKHQEMFWGDRLFYIMRGVWIAWRDSAFVKIHLKVGGFARQISSWLSTYLCIMVISMWGNCRAYVFSSLLFFVFSKCSICDFHKQKNNDSKTLGANNFHLLLK